MKKYSVATSILTADFLNLGNELEKLQKAGIKWLHYDVMDFHFVKNLTFGPKILADINKKYNFKIDVHLMVEILNWSVEEYLKPFIEAGTNQISVHYESLTDLQIKDFIKVCKKHNIKSSLAINPDTGVDEIQSYLPELDNVLVMSVYPGFGGQVFLNASIEKIESLVKLREKNNYKYLIEVDGGINAETSILVKEAGVDMLVAGSFLVNGDTAELCERVELLEK